MADALVLPACVDARAAAGIWRELGARVPPAIDFAAVREIDSAGVALVAALRRRHLAVGGRDSAGTRAFPLLNVPDRFAQLCAAHRIDKELLP
ncbi:MAG TPA: hypothetical protein VND91_12410 [Candidatus Saccharimonadia bacterium]|nr:hypothetical protein [Candidatus Saccharimonadia bacterium]